MEAGVIQPVDAADRERALAALGGRPPRDITAAHAEASMLVENIYTVALSILIFVFEQGRGTVRSDWLRVARRASSTETLATRSERGLPVQPFGLDRQQFA